MCSTPFGIKGFVTPRRPPCQSARIHVLNAFRHQRICHRHGSRDLSALPQVLNAFRHQRICHDCIYRLFQCQPVRVLNAFRHQRICHTRIPIASAIAIKCSTPFGIKGFVTTKVSWVNDSLTVCSTPFGIKGFVTAGVASHWLLGP